MTLIRTLGALVVGLAVFVGVAQADVRTLTPNEVKALTIKAADYIATKGLEEAEKAFSREGEFKFGEIYVNVIDMDGNWVIYPPTPENKGKSILNFIDEDGKELGEEILGIGKKGAGWAEYRWKNPATDRIQPKMTYVKKVPGKGYIAYIGVYK